MNIEVQVFELFKKFDTEFENYVKNRKGIISEI